MAQLAKVSAAKPEDLSSSSMIHMVERIDSQELFSDLNIGTIGHKCPGTYTQRECKQDFKYMLDTLVYPNKPVDWLVAGLCLLQTGGLLVSPYGEDALKSHRKLFASLKHFQWYSLSQVLQRCWVSFMKKQGRVLSDKATHLLILL